MTSAVVDLPSRQCTTTTFLASLGNTTSKQQGTYKASRPIIRVLYAYLIRPGARFRLQLPHRKKCINMPRGLKKA